MRLPKPGRAARADTLKVQLEKTSGLIDRFLEALMSAAPDRLDSVLTQDCRIRLVAGGADWVGRGAEARERLVEVLHQDRAIQGRQLRVDVHPGLSQWAILGAYASKDASTQERLMIVQVTADAVSGLDYYQLPLVSS